MKKWIVSSFFSYNRDVNQILSVKEIKKNTKKIVKYYKLILIGMISLIIIVSLFCLNDKLEFKNNIIYSKNINMFGRIEEIYSNNDYEENNKYFGRIVIEKIDLDYMILNNFTDENLEISICRINGDNINENISLVGHNFENDMFFSNIDKLVINDKIVLYVKNKEYVYKVYKIYEVYENDLSPLQDNEISEVTLITCNNFNKKRVIIKAKK